MQNVPDVIAFARAEAGGLKPLRADSAAAQNKRFGASMAATPAVESRSTSIVNRDFNKRLLGS
ncbi:MAG: hypothetical protein AAF989_08165 [Planctomycetota bacterium]